MFHLVSQDEQLQQIEQNLAAVRGSDVRFVVENKFPC